MIDDQLLQQAIELATSRDQLQRRNERERNRVNRVNIAFENLRSKLTVASSFFHVIVASFFGNFLPRLVLLLTRAFMT